MAYGHLGWKRHPWGMFSAEGTSPLMGTSLIRLTLPAMGSHTAVIKALVYGCIELSMTLLGLPISTIFPKYITAILSVKYLAVDRSWVMYRYVRFNSR